MILPILNFLPKVLTLRGLSPEPRSPDTIYSLPERNNFPIPPFNMDLVDAFRELALTIQTNRNQSEFKPEGFSGLPTEDFDLFVQKFTQWCDFLGKTIEERRQFLPFLLKGYAYEKYSGFSDETKEDYGTLLRCVKASHTFFLIAKIRIIYSWRF